MQLPRRYRLATEMNLLYSLDQHGISLSTLYRLVKNVKGPIVLVVKDADDNVSVCRLKRKEIYLFFSKGVWGISKRNIKIGPSLLRYRRMVRKKREKVEKKN